MLFNSYVFLYVFLPLSIVGYYWLGYSFGSRAAKVYLCIASFVFYGWWNPAFILLLVGSIAFNYFISLRLRDEEERTPHQGWILAFGVVANLFLLFYYKYLFPLLGFFHSVGLNHIDYGSVILPIGISFFTFTQIGYLVDCHQGLVKGRSLLNYVLFVTFFPHLIAGPILHHKEVMPQFADDSTYRLKLSNIAIGLTLLAVGMVKKVLLADTIAPWAEAGFADLHSIQLLHGWSVALAYSMQLYFDFSGYSDMAIGLGIMFGIKLPLNFNSPYKSISIIDFWQRWHITLTRYLTLLLYNPIALWVSRRRQQAGQSIGKAAASTLPGFANMIAMPTVTTMFLAGIWHGAGLQYIVYGLLHGIYLTVNHAWRIFVKAPAKKVTQTGLKEKLVLVGSVALTYLAVLLAQIFFRANNVSDAVELVAGMTGFHGSGMPIVIPANNVQYLGPLSSFLIDHGILKVGLRETYNLVTLPLVNNLLLALGLGIIAFGAPNIYQLLGDNSPALNKVKSLEWKWAIWKPTFASAIVVAMLLFIATLYFDRTARFLYFQF
jgi:D-alanyl-lipoteichoic acid acyltransferase DltB (MBOAT superfamily)